MGTAGKDTPSFGGIAKLICCFQGLLSSEKRLHYLSESLKRSIFLSLFGIHEN